MMVTMLTPSDFKIWRGISKRKSRTVSIGVAARPESAYDGEAVKQLSDQLEMFPDLLKEGSKEENMLNEYRVANSGCMSGV